MTHPLDALGDAHRREVLHLLRDGGLPVGQIADAMPISRPAVSRHLRILKDAGLVEERAEGTRRVYELADAGAQAVQVYLESVWGEATARFRLLAENSGLTDAPEAAAMNDPDEIRFSFEVDCPREHAFGTWTEKFSTWWPADHTVSGSSTARVELQPGVGGQIREQLPDGSEHIWGEVTTWDPPDLLGYRWHLGRAPSAATDVLIRFVDIPDGRTRIDIEHSGWTGQGADGAVWRARNTGGWQSLLPHVQAALEAVSR